MAVTAIKNRVDFDLQTERVGDDLYSFYPLGEHIVAVPGVCGGRPTIKYTRLDARHVVAMLNAGETAEEIAARHNIPLAAVEEAVALSTFYDYEASYA